MGGCCCLATPPAPQLLTASPWALQAAEQQPRGYFQCEYQELTKKHISVFKHNYVCTNTAYLSAADGAGPGSTVPPCVSKEGSGKLLSTERFLWFKNSLTILTGFLFPSIIFRGGLSMDFALPWGDKSSPHSWGCCSLWREKVQSQWQSGGGKLHEKHQKATKRIILLPPNYLRKYPVIFFSKAAHTKPGPAQSVRVQQDGLHAGRHFVSTPALAVLGRGCMETRGQGSAGAGLCSGQRPCRGITSECFSVLKLCCSYCILVGRWGNTSSFCDRDITFLHCNSSIPPVFHHKERKWHPCETVVQHLQVSAMHEPCSIQAPKHFNTFHI